MTEILHLSDLHFGAEDAGVMRALEDTMAQMHPTVIAITGDLTQRGKKREFAAARRFIEALDAPVIVAPGNHDTPLLHLGARLTRPFARYKRFMGGAAMDWFQTPALAVAGLNTARGVQWRLDWSLGAVSRKATRTAIALLLGSPATARKVVVCHHPLAPPPNAPFPSRTRGGARAVETLVEAGIDAVLSGHMHVAFAESYALGDGRTHAIGAGTTVTGRLRGAAPGFNRLIFDADRLVVEHYEWHGAFVCAAKENLPLRSQQQAS